MSKFVAKFRKDRDYNDDYFFSNRKKRSNQHNPTKKLINYDYDESLQDDEMEYQKPVRKKLKQY